MIIRIKQNKSEESKGRNIFFPVPLFVFKWRFVREQLSKELEGFETVVPLLIDALREYKRKNGHWTLVEVDTADGESIRIEM